MASRRRARELALQMLFQWDLGGHAPAHVVATFLDAQRVEDETKSFAQALFEGAVAHAGQLDALIRNHTENWRLERLAAVDRNVMRLAAYELLYEPETPPAVTMNEALELARRFSSEESVEFVNGVLDAIRRQTAAGSDRAANGAG